MKKKHKHIKLLILTGALITIQLFSGECKAQEEVFSLPQCIQRAVENNIQIKRQALNSNYSLNEAQQAKYNRLPSVNGSSSYSYNMGKTLSSDNTYKNENSSSLNLGLSGDVNIFNGFAVENTIKKTQIDYQASLKDLEKAKDDISLQVVSYYLDILLNKELVETAKEQLKVTELQIEYNKKQVAAGNMAKGKLFETQAQAANEELSVTNYENRLQLAKVNLQQLLELEVSESFDISTPEIDADIVSVKLLQTDSVFRFAVERRPEIASQELKLESAKINQKIVESQYMPSVYAGASLNSGFYSNSKEVEMTATGPVYGNVVPFGTQIDNNLRGSIYAGLRIPIFNKFNTRTQVQNSRITIENQTYLLEYEKNQLRKEIEQVHTNAIAAMKRFYSSKKAVESAKEAFRYVEEKFKLGIVTPLEYNQSKNQVINAESTHIQAKFEYIFRTKILDFYMGNDLSL